MTTPWKTEVVPGHPIWNEVWGRCHPNNTFNHANHLEQLFEALWKLDVLTWAMESIKGQLQHIAQEDLSTAEQIIYRRASIALKSIGQTPGSVVD